MFSVTEKQINVQLASRNFDVNREWQNPRVQIRQEGVDFAFESTLAGRSYISFLRDVRNAGYRVELYYFWLPSPEMAIQRVADRVASGGHHIPEATIRQRFSGGTTTT